MRHNVYFALWGVVRVIHGLPACGPGVPWGVLAGTNWDDSTREMSHQRANPLWLCRVSGHGRDHGRGTVMWTSFIHV